MICSLMQCISSTEVKAVIGIVSQSELTLEGIFSVYQLLRTNVAQHYS